MLSFAFVHRTTYLLMQSLATANRFHVSDFDRPNNSVCFVLITYYIESGFNEALPVSIRNEAKCRITVPMAGHV